MGDVTAATLASLSFSGDTASRSADHSKDGWFDPGERKKHQDSRPTIDVTGQPVTWNCHLKETMAINNITSNILWTISPTVVILVRGPKSLLIG